MADSSVDALDASPHTCGMRDGRSFAQRLGERASNAALPTYRRKAPIGPPFHGPRSIGTRRLLLLILTGLMTAVGVFATVIEVQDAVGYGASSPCPSPVTADRACRYLVAGVVTRSDVPDSTITIALSTGDTTTLDVGDSPMPGVGDPITVTFWAGRPYAMQWDDNYVRTDDGVLLGPILLASMVGWPGLAAFAYFLMRFVTETKPRWATMLAICGWISSLVAILGGGAWLGEVLVLAVGLAVVTVIGPLLDWRWAHLSFIENNEDWYARHGDRAYAPLP